MRLLLLSSLVLGSVAAIPLALTACSSDETSSGGEDNLTISQAGSEGSVCNETKKCRLGLACKPKPSGPPPGAVGLPVPATATQPSGPPPGAVGLPVPVETTCQHPEEGEEGSFCFDDSDCHGGLACRSHASSSSSSSTGGTSGGTTSSTGGTSGGTTSSTGGTSGGTTSSTGGPPPGAVGLPVPPSTSTSGGPPPGAVGLPLPPGTCQQASGSSSGGPPPGAVGLPIPPKD